MSQEQAERALQSLYEESGTRDELADDEAEILLKWAETQIQRLADQNMDDEKFDETYSQIIKLMTRMNRFAARRAEQSLEDQQTSLSRIAESASAVGLAIPEAQLAAYLEQPVAQDGGTHIQGLITLVAGNRAGPANAAGVASAAGVANTAEEASAGDGSDGGNAGIIAAAAVSLAGLIKSAVAPPAKTSEPKVTPAAEPIKSMDTPAAQPSKIEPTEKAESDDEEIQ